MIENVTYTNEEIQTNDTDTDTTTIPTTIPSIFSNDFENIPEPEYDYSKHFRAIDGTGQFIGIHGEREDPLKDNTIVPVIPSDDPDQLQIKENAIVPIEILEDKIYKDGKKFSTISGLELPIIKPGKGVEITQDFLQALETGDTEIFEEQENDFYIQAMLGEEYAVSTKESIDTICTEINDININENTNVSEFDEQYKEFNAIDDGSLDTMTIEGNDQLDKYTKDIEEFANKNKIQSIERTVDEYTKIPDSIKIKIQNEIKEKEKEWEAEDVEDISIQNEKLDSIYKKNTNTSIWDIESICSRYTTTQNRMRIINERRVRLQKQEPFTIVPTNNMGTTIHDDKDSDDDNKMIYTIDSNEKIASEPLYIPQQQQQRRKGEDREERKARKALVKSQKSQKRIQNKAVKSTYTSQKNSILQNQATNPLSGYSVKRIS